MKNDIILNSKLLNSLFQNRRKKLRNEALFSLLMYETNWVSSRIGIKERKVGQKLLKEGLINVIPKVYFERAERQIIRIIDNINRGNSIIRDLNNLKEFTYDPITFELNFNDSQLNEFDIIYSSEIQNLEYYSNYAQSTIGLFKNVLFNSYSKKKKFNPELLATFNLRRFSPASHLGEKFEEAMHIMKIYDWQSGLDDTIEFHTIKDLENLYDTQLDDFLADNNIKFRSTNSRAEKLQLYRKHLRKQFELDYFLEMEKLRFVNEYVNLREFLDYSHTSKIPIKFPISSIDKETIKISEQSDYSYNVYKIILDEIQFMPKLNSIEDVLRLRNDKRIIDFREAIKHWSEILTEGEVDIEAKLRLDINKSNNEFKSFQQYEKISGWATYVSLPFIVVDLFSGVPIGSILTAVSGAYQFKASKVKKKYSWLLLGNTI